MNKYNGKGVIMINQKTKKLHNDWAEKTALSVMRRKPEINTKWEYEDGVVLQGMELVYHRTNDRKYLDYMVKSMDLFVDADGNIPKYAPTEYNIDHINNGKVLLALYEHTGEKRYKKAAALLRDQLRTHPRTSEGAFWHKMIYPYQIWLDGLYMGSVFYARYIQEFGEEHEFDDVLKQFDISYRHTRDDQTGLLHHAWDEKKEQPWCDKDTGLSKHFWSRSVGWYVMAIVDVLDYLPIHHDGRKKLLRMLEETLAALMLVQDKESGTWYQILNQHGRKGNYLESSGTVMILYAIAKGIRKGYLPEKWFDQAERIYRGILDEFILETKEGFVNVNKICQVAGLGGKDKRDGSFAYYISEPIVANDHKGVGPFILASAEMEMLQAKK
ncbi:unsaturated rhamnogalacturonyl hydrolase [Terribacillus halophilus]|uniref:Unsaturated rhamnogalacturonyl hydrolase n=2 Tax=Terribacillus halophilus TaxID=361279 RepID=A0A1G6I325_9BACI|nr:unsaturated rhamnogalacturonyl hydrolase [Terribacillus halophilus]